jgi:hypothetical protein
MKSTSDVIIGFDSIKTQEGSNARPFDILRGMNLGSRTMVLAMPFRQFKELSQVANRATIASISELDGSPVTQRELVPEHAQGLASYMLKGMVQTAILTIEKKGDAVPSGLYQLRDDLGKQPYLGIQPIVANLRSVDFGGSNLRMRVKHKDEDGNPVSYQVLLSDHDILWIIDGQHRRAAMDILHEYVKGIVQTQRYPKKGNLVPTDRKGDSLTGSETITWNAVWEQLAGENTLVVEVHLGLSAEQERQLFHDLNNLGKKVPTGLALAFDASNPINIFIKDKLIGEERVAQLNVSEADQKDWHNDNGEITRKDLTAINAFLFLGSGSEKKCTPKEIAAMESVAVEFWKQVTKIRGFGESGARTKTVAAQPVVLKALAKLLNQFHKRPETRQWSKILLETIPVLDLSHTNKVWRYYILKNTESAPNLEGLDAYLPTDEEGQNRDIGAFDTTNEWFRFSPRTNDVIPILGDFFRWMIKAPSRHS